MLNKANQEYLDKLLKGFEYTPVGSSVVPSVKDPEDYDFAVLDEKGELFLDLNWSLGGSPGAGLFTSFRTVQYGQNLNLIVHSKREDYEQYVAASGLCVKFDLTSKSDRVLLHEAHEFAKIFPDGEFLSCKNAMEFIGLIPFGILDLYKVPQEVGSGAKW